MTLVFRLPATGFLDADPPVLDRLTDSPCAAECPGGAPPEPAVRGNRSGIESVSA